MKVRKVKRLNQKGKRTLTLEKEYITLNVLRSNSCLLLDIIRIYIYSNFIEEEEVVL